MANLVEIHVPAVGESISEATIGKWSVNSGDWVEKDALVFEIETEKATMEVTAPASGKVNVAVPSGSTVPIGSVVGTIDTAAAKPAGATATPSTPPPPSKPPPGAPTSNGRLPPPPPSGVSLSPEGHVSPQPAVTTPPPPQAHKGVGPAKRKAIREGRASLPTVSPSFDEIEPTAEGVRRVPMSVIRKKIAERLMFSQNSTATLTTFNEVDMSNVLNLRVQLKDKFQSQFGVKLGFMSFFAKAVCAAAAEVQTLNAYIDGSDILYHDHVHLGVAVSTDRGLVVPVVRNANHKNFAQLEKDIGMFAEKARSGKLGIEDMLGGTFTLTNGGVFGSLLSTPILNPPQSGILGMHKTENRPVAVEKNGQWTMEVKPMMYLAMSYDHRLVDGRDSVTFLVKVKGFLESVTADVVLS
jgi:2-oxoglutarate dehydrogenase E2 component (dihydrolipoamide succinyltransferase)